MPINENQEYGWLVYGRFNVINHPEYLIKNWLAWI